MNLIDLGLGAVCGFIAGCLFWEVFACRFMVWKANCVIRELRARYLAVRYREDQP